MTCSVIVEAAREVERLAQSCDPVERSMAAHLAPPSMLDQLAEDADHMVRLYVAMNPDTPADARKKLARDGHPVVAEVTRRVAAAL